MNNKIILLTISGILICTALFIKFFLRNIQIFSMFYNPLFLALLILIPMAWYVYNMYLEKKIKYLAVNYSYSSVVQVLNIKIPLWKKLLYPIILSLVAMCCIFAISRPYLLLKIPKAHADIAVVIDVSWSMVAEDIEPNRLEVCKEEISKFIIELPEDARVGILLFAGESSILTPPIKDKKKLVTLISNIDEDDLREKTDIGQAIYFAKEMLNQDAQEQSESERAIVLLSDGATTDNAYPCEETASKVFQEDNIRIYTIAFGASEGVISVIDPKTGEPTEYEVFFDPDKMERVAESGGGIFFRAVNQNDLANIYNDIKEKTRIYENQEIEITSFFAGLALCLILFMTAFAFRYLWIYKNI